jgi:FkbM family methyltransferase
MSTNIPHYEENARRIRTQPPVDPDEALERMRSSQVEMRASIDNGAWQNTRWHESFTDLFVDEIRKARVFIDVGAELGFYSYLALKHMPENGRIICVEADPVRCELLRELFVRDPRVQVLNVAAHSTTTELTLTKPVGCSATSANVEGARFSVRADTIDNIIGDSDVDVIKIDIEGAEAHALEGPEVRSNITRGPPDQWLRRCAEASPAGPALLRRGPSVYAWQTSTHPAPSDVFIEGGQQMIRTALSSSPAGRARQLVCAASCCCSEPSPLVHLSHCIDGRRYLALSVRLVQDSSVQTEFDGDHGHNRGNEAEEDQRGQSD